LSQSLSALALVALPRAALARPEDVAYAMTADFGKIAPTDGRVTLDLPDHSDAGTSVPLTLTVESPMTTTDYPATVGLYGSGNPRPRIATVQFTPLGGLAQFSTRIRLNSAQDVVAVAQMSGGEFFRGTKRVTVTFGACNTAGESDKLPKDWQPQTKVAVPKDAKAGDIITIRTVITHPMETGLRLDANNAYLPLWIIQRFICRLDGAEVINIKLEPAIATNPYLAFALRAEKSGVLAFEWHDSKGPVYTATAPLQLV
jgi:sulfur-oxidizing protein SoxY